MSYYEVLGVRRDASTQDIERAFKQLARRFHPDLNVGDREAEPVMKELNLIRATLTDPGARAAYDDKLRGDRTRAARPPPPAAAAAARSPAAAAAPDAAARGAAWMDTSRPPPPAAARVDVRAAAAAAAREPAVRFAPVFAVAGIVVGSGLLIGLLLLIKHFLGTSRPAG